MNGLTFNPCRLDVTPTDQKPPASRSKMELTVHQSTGEHTPLRPRSSPTPRPPLNAVALQGDWGHEQLPGVPEGLHMSPVFCDEPWSAVLQGLVIPDPHHEPELDLSC